MQLTHYTDYSLRVLLYLAMQEDDRLITVGEIAERFQIARNHLVKVANRLGQLGYVEAVRGKGGGLRLGMQPHEIGLGQVVRDMENQMDIIDCNKPPCPIIGACTLKGVFNRAMGAFLDVLDEHTLDQLLVKPNPYKDLLRAVAAR